MVFFVLLFLIFLFLAIGILTIFERFFLALRQLRLGPNKNGF